MCLQKAASEGALGAQGALRNLLYPWPDPPTPLLLTSFSSGLAALRCGDSFTPFRLSIRFSIPESVQGLGFRVPGSGFRV